MSAKKRLYEGKVLPAALYGVKNIEYRNSRGEEIVCSGVEASEKHVWSNINWLSET